MILEKIYNSLDALSEQHGIHKIETIDNTFIACSGINILEREMDDRLISNHHCVRVTDFAFKVSEYANTVQLRNGRRLKVKIGIHLGEVFGGVIGEIKPHFTIIGGTL